MTDRVQGDFEVIPDTDHAPISGDPNVVHEVGERVPEDYFECENLHLEFGVPVEVFQRDGFIHIYPQRSVREDEAVIEGEVQNSIDDIEIIGQAETVYQHGLSRIEYQIGVSKNPECGIGFRITGTPFSESIDERRFIGNFEDDGDQF